MDAGRPKPRSAMKGEGVPDAGSLGELEEAEVHVRRAFKKMERMMAIADTACATNAYPLVDVAPVDPGWQENDPVLQKVEQAVCSSEYPFVKFLLGSYRNYWKARCPVSGRLSCRRMAAVSCVPDGRTGSGRRTGRGGVMWFFPWSMKFSPAFISGVPG